LTKNTTEITGSKNGRNKIARNDESSLAQCFQHFSIELKYYVVWAFMLFANGTIDRSVNAQQASIINGVPCFDIL